ncbi:hypothetical protein AVEN_154370-1 [Araneus ventricosus]|uniref:DDE-1 domain-containing protein n=1 Tax=Araneus ventricosus TaxID=182803 RepID=A0A4Y2M387_ARAVE|nr:hypothetical protein AVEN_154370-1 [Araneus ventricosus]
MLEDFEIPVVNGKAKKPRCSKNIDVRKLSVSWKSNKKAWISTEIMSDCEELAKSVSVLDAISWNTSALKKVEPRCVLKCFKKAGFLSTSEVTAVSTTEKREKEFADLVANLDSNVSVEEHVKIEDDLFIEEENLHVSNFIH